MPKEYKNSNGEFWFGTLKFCIISKFMLFSGKSRFICLVDESKTTFSYLNWELLITEKRKKKEKRKN